MLKLLTAPAWQPEGEVAVALPATLPAALLLVLASRGQWMTRESLALIFWPESAPADALHHLRVNLHRTRQLLDSWGQGSALQAERARLRLVLPTDVGQTHTGAASPAQWLQGWRLPGYDGFAQWCDDTGAALQREWLAAQTAPGAARTPLSATPVSTPPAAGDSAQASGRAPPGREAAFQRLLASPAPALLLLGDPGAGKTTLLRSAWPHAPVLRGLEGLHAMPYRPLLEALRLHLPVLQRALREPAAPLRPYRLDLARVLPELAPEEPLPPLDALTAQTRLVEALARAFEALTPLLLVDDLQWCDSATVEWLLMLAHTGRLRWRAAARRHELPPALAQALQGLRSAVRLEDMDVPPLSRSSLAEACAQRWPAVALEAAQLDHLHALSGGNPFLLGELMAAGALDASHTAGRDGHSLLERLGPLLQARMHGLPPAVQHLVQAAAVFVQPVPIEALQGPVGSGAQAEAAAHLAVAAGLLQHDATGYSCRHDLIRQAVRQAMAAPQRQALHRRAGLWLAQRSDADALTIAEHWRAAQEPQTALAWCHRGAEQLKQRGRFDDARALWHTVAEQSLDAAQALRARLELAACDLFADLGRGRNALEAVCAQLAAVADAEQRRQIEGRALSALVDNRVFAGDIASAQQHAARLRELLPLLPPADRIDGIEVLIELAMREPDIPAAWALLSQLRQLAPQRPTLLSWEGQIHWFGGQVQAAHDALARLLERHPDYCRGITIENDLAVMLQALGETDAAEAMARRSLQSWAGVAHTETLSLLVLGLVLTSAGRHDEADAALLRALQLAREQDSAGFEAEAQVRRARLLLERGDFEAAQAALDAAAPLLKDSPEPLRVSQWALAQVLAAAGRRQPVPVDAVARLEQAAARSQHPLVQVRLARVAFEQARQQGRAADALQAALQQASVARMAGLQEPAAEAWLLQALARQAGGEAPSALWPLVERAAEQARRKGYAHVLARARGWLASKDGPGPTGSLSSAAK